MVFSKNRWQCADDANLSAGRPWGAAIAMECRVDAPECAIGGLGRMMAAVARQARMRCAWKKVISKWHFCNAVVL